MKRQSSSWRNIPLILPGVYERNNLLQMEKLRLEKTGLKIYVNACLPENQNRITYLNLTNNAAILSKYLLPALLYKSVDL